MTRRRELLLPPIHLDRASEVPLRRQIYQQIAHGIHSGEIRSDSRLPATRGLARALCVSRNTILAAYDDLMADGLIRGEQGSGTRVNGDGLLRPPVIRPVQDLIRAAHYPSKTVAILDPDENALYLRY